MVLSHWPTQIPRVIQMAYITGLVVGQCEDIINLINRRKS